MAGGSDVHVVVVIFNVFVALIVCWRRAYRLERMLHVCGRYLYQIQMYPVFVRCDLYGLSLLVVAAAYVARAR